MGPDLLLDTHVWAWSLYRSEKLSHAARQLVAAGPRLWTSPASLYEVGQKVRLGKWPEMEPYVDGLDELLDGSGIQVAPLTPRLALGAGLLDWPHRDPFDWIIAATAQAMGLPLVSKDAAFDSVPGGLHRIW